MNFNHVTLKWQGVSRGVTVKRRGFRDKDLYSGVSWHFFLIIISDIFSPVLSGLCYCSVSHNRQLFVPPFASLFFIALCDPSSIHCHPLKLWITDDNNIKLNKNDDSAIAAPRLWKYNVLAHHGRPNSDRETLPRGWRIVLPGQDWCVMRNEGIDLYAHLDAVIGNWQDVNKTSQKLKMTRQTQAERGYRWYHLKVTEFHTKAQIANAIT